MFEYRHNKCVGPHSPAGQNFQQNYGNKKRRGSKILSAPIPDFRPSHCPFIRISNVKACPRRAIYIHYDLSSQTYIYEEIPSQRVHLIIYKGESGAGDIKSPTRTLLLHHRCMKIQSCEVWNHRQVTLRKRPFETSPTNGLVSRSIDVI